MLWMSRCQENPNVSETVGEINCDSLINDITISMDCITCFNIIISVSDCIVFVCDYLVIFRHCAPYHYI